MQRKTQRVHAHKKQEQERKHQKIQEFKNKQIKKTQKRKEPYNILRIQEYTKIQIIQQNTKNIANK